MHKSKLFRLLSGLNPDEFARFSKFVASPFYNTNPTQVKFYKLLKKAYPTFDQKNLKREKVFQRLYPGKPFNYHLLGNLVSDMIRLTDTYLLTLQMEKEEMAQKKLLLRAYSERPEFYSDFVKRVNNMHKYLDDLPHRNAAYYREKFRLEQLYFNHTDTDKFKLKGEQYDDAMRHLDQWYILEKLLMSCELKAREKPLSEKHEIWLLKEIKNNIAELKNEDSIAETYLTMLNLLEHGEEKTYFDLKKIFIQNLEYFDKKQQLNILQSLINFAIQKGNRGNKIFLAENLELYKLGLEHKLFIRQKVMNGEIYSNIIIVSLKLKKFAWCKDFINDYSHYLIEPIRQDAKSLGLAFWYYYQDRFDEAHEFLNRIKFINEVYKLRAKTLLLRVCFLEIKNNSTYLEVLELQILSFKKYLKRNKNFSKEWIKTYENFATYLWQLAKLNLTKVKDKNAQFALKEKITNEDLVFQKSWILNQFN